MTSVIFVNLDALSHDAKAWSCVSSELRGIATATSDVDAPSSVFRCVDSARQVADEYARILANFGSALTKGATQTTLGSGVLAEIAADYREDEIAAAEEYDKLWEVYES